MHSYSKSQGLIMSDKQSKLQWTVLVFVSLALIAIIIMMVFVVRGGGYLPKESLESLKSSAKKIEYYTLELKDLADRSAAAAKEDEVEHKLNQENRGKDWNELYKKYGLDDYITGDRNGVNRMHSENKDNRGEQLPHDKNQLIIVENLSKRSCENEKGSNCTSSKR